MKKKDVLNLIKYYAENNDAGFRNEAYKIANYFDQIGDYQLSEYIMALMSNTNTFVPQMIEEEEGGYFVEIKVDSTPLPLPEKIKDDILGVINAVGHRAGVNKFLFEGMPGTGKTETAKQLARILDRKLFSVEFDSIIDSKLGQTSKNLVDVFKKINNLANPHQVIVLFDELDALALDRIQSNDLREMGRVTSTLLKELDKLNEDVIFIATTNLFENFDKALVRRFDSIINFNRYTQEDLVEVGETILNSFLNKFKFAGRNMRLFKKILNQANEIPYPGELKNLIKISLAFSNPDFEFDYLKKLFSNLVGEEKLIDIKDLYQDGFTIREIEILTGVSKSQVSRELKE